MHVLFSVTHLKNTIDVSLWVKGDRIEINNQQLGEPVDDHQSYYANVLSELHACGSYVQLQLYRMRLSQCFTVCAHIDVHIICTFCSHSFSLGITNRCRCFLISDVDMCTNSGVCVKFGKSPHAISNCLRTTFLSSDRLALKLMPSDASIYHVSPVSVSAHGNSLPRSGSFLAFDHENFADEIWARLVIELVLNEDYYLNGSFLQ